MMDRRGFIPRLLAGLFGVRALNDAAAASAANLGVPERLDVATLAEPAAAVPAPRPPASADARTFHLLPRPDARPIPFDLYLGDTHILGVYMLEWEDREPSDDESPTVLTATVAWSSVVQQLIAERRIADYAIQATPGSVQVTLRGPLSMSIEDMEAHGREVRRRARLRHMRMRKLSGPKGRLP